jgi:hypothetical protein
MGVSIKLCKRRKDRKRRGKKKNNVLIMSLSLFIKDSFY